MNRKPQILLGTLLFLLVVTVVHHIWANWGLITVHAKGQPLAAVIASIQRQGHAVIQTDMPADTLVTMDVVRVPLTDALETLATVTEGRWRLLYFAAGDKATLKAGETSWATAGQRPQGWRMVSFPMQNMFLATGDDDDDGTTPPPDPRQDVWTVKTAAPAPVQTFLAEAAQLTNAGFAFPEAWNPNVKSAPASGEVRKVVPKLIGAAGGKVDQVFFLSKPFGGRRRGPGDQAGATAGGPPPPDGAGGRGNFQRMDPSVMAAHTQAEIDRLPPAQKAVAQDNFNRERAFWQSLQGLTDEQRRQAIQQHMQDPEVQQQMAARGERGESRMGHDQRLQHFQHYVNRKLAARGKQ